MRAAESVLQVSSHRPVALCALRNIGLYISHVKTVPVEAQHRKIVCSLQKHGSQVFLVVNVAVLHVLAFSDRGFYH